MRDERVAHGSWKTCLLRGAILGIALGTPAAAQIRVVNYNIAGLNGNQAALQDVFAGLAADDKPGFAVAPHLYVFQEVHDSDVGPILVMLNASAPPGVTYAQGTYTNFNENGASGAEAMFYRADTLTEDVAGHVDIYSQASRYADRWKLQLIGYTSPESGFYIYSAHLKASTGSTNAQTRLTGATAIRSNADALPSGTHIIYAGDFNVYNNLEPAYLKFLSTGSGQALDPLGTESWAGAANAIKHTQAPCAGTCALVNGGMDDRFDHQLSTAAFQDGAGLALIPGTFRSFGNDGNHYDQSINAGNNTYYPGDIPRSNALAADLYVASDHVPVVVDYQRPAVMAATLEPDFDRVIEGASLFLTVSISNTADALVQAGADELDYVAVGSGALIGSAEGSVAALSAPAMPAFPVDTTTIGSVSGSVEVTSTSQAVQNPSIHLPTGGTVIRHANASFSSFEDDDFSVVAESFEPDTGVQAINVELYNLSYDNLQATLDVDALGGLSAPFDLSGPLPTNIGSGAAAIPLSIDTTGLAPGTFIATLDIQVSDEDLTGETTATLSLTLEIQIGSAVIPGDVNCDGVLTLGDVDVFVDVVLALDVTPCHVQRADFDQSTVVDGLDITNLVNIFLN
jgi:hypothetical protein